MNRTVGIKTLHQGTERKISESIKSESFNPKIWINIKIGKTGSYDERTMFYQNDFKSLSTYQFFHINLNLQNI